MSKSAKSANSDAGKGKGKSSAASVVAAGAPDPDFERSDDEDEDDGLLPLDVSPTHYALRLVPNYADWTFRARLIVSLRVSAETDIVQFNAADLHIDEATISTAAGETLIPTRIDDDDEEEVTTLRFDAPLLIGDCTLTIRYHGAIGDDMIGLYRSHYQHAV